MSPTVGGFAKPKSTLALAAPGSVELNHDHILAIALGGQRIGDAKGGLYAEIGLDQQIFQFLQRVFVELALGEERGNLARELRRCAGKTLPQSLEPAELCFRRFHDRFDDGRAGSKALRKHRIGSRLNGRGILPLISPLEGEMSRRDRGG